MNLLSMVMGLLLIFACTFTVSLRKATLAQHVETTYQAHMDASRQILNTYESICYQRMRGEKKESSEKKNTSTPKKRLIEPVNLDCARLNLWPLVIDGKEKHPALYETAAQLLSAFYSQSLFVDQQRFEYQILDAIIEAARKAKTDSHDPRILLEKLSVKGNVKPLYTLQTIYYRMLRGTKNISQNQGFSSILEYFIIENKPTHICLQHASQEMLSALFGPRAAIIVFNEMQESEVPLSRERIQEICAQNGRIGLSGEFLNLLEWQTSHHHLSQQKTLTQQDSNVCLKQRVFLPS